VASGDHQGLVDQRCQQIQHQVALDRVADGQRDRFYSPELGW
jgi:hypothetical protein